MSYDEIRCKDPVSQQGNAIRKGVNYNFRNSIFPFQNSICFNFFKEKTEEFKNLMRLSMCVLFQVCEILDFSCIQLNGSIFLTRRPLDDPNACWESEIRPVAAGCECLWPKHENGDISIYHE